MFDELKFRIYLIWNTLRVRWNALRYMPLHITIRLWWHGLWLREDEFHDSYELDIEAMWFMGSTDRESYVRNVMNRRDEAHQRDMEENE